MDKVGIRTIVVNFEDEQLPYLSLVQGDAKTRGFDIVICDSDGKEIAPSDDYIVELVATGSNAPDTPYANRHTIEDGKYRVMIPTEALSESGFVFLQLVFYQKSTGAVIHTIEQKCPVYRSRGQEVVESNNLYVDITALRLGIEKIAVMETAYLQVLEDEATRKSNEIKREENETRRLSSESQILSAEKQRVSNEKQRNENESKRITAEKERETKFDGWDKTMEGIFPNATDTEKGVVKISALDTEEAPYTTVSIGKLEEDMSALEDRIAADTQSFKDTTVSENNALKARLDKGYNEVTTQLAQKAEQIQTLETNKMDKNTTNISASQINKNNGKFDQTYMTDDFLQQMAGNSPVNAIPADDSITADKLANKSVIPDKIDGAILSPRNMIALNNVKNGYIVSGTGEVVEDEISFGGLDRYTDFIRVYKDETYTISVYSNIIWFDESKNFISGLQGSAPYIRTITSPNDGYMRVCFKSEDLEKIQITKTNAPSNYIAPKYLLDNFDIKDNYIEGRHFKPAHDNVNIFDKNRVVHDWYISHARYVYYPSTPPYIEGTSGTGINFISEKIKVDPSSEYHTNQRTVVAFYDLNDSVLGVEIHTGTFTTPSNVSHIRISAVGSEANRLQVEKGDAFTGFKPFRYDFENEPDASTAPTVPYSRGTIWGGYNTNISFRETNNNVQVVLSGDTAIYPFNEKHGPNNRILFTDPDRAASVNWVLPTLEHGVNNEGVYTFDMPHNTVLVYDKNTHSIKLLEDGIYELDPDHFVLAFSHSGRIRGGFFVEMLTHLQSQENVLPSHFQHELDNVIGKSIAGVKNSTLDFAFITDTHGEGTTKNRMMTYLDIVKEYEKTGSLDFVSHGGDWTAGYMYEDIEGYRNLFREYAKQLRSIKKPFLPLFGNHDDNSYGGSVSGDYMGNTINTVLTKDDWSGIMMKPFNDGWVLDSQEPDTRYFYKDFEQQKVRVIVLDGVDNPYDEDSEGLLRWQGRNSWGFAPRQVEWLSTEALDFSDKGDDKSNWGVVVMCHLAPTSDVSNYTSELNNGVVVRDILNAFCEGGSVANQNGTGNFPIENFSCNFEDQGEMEVIMWAYGHTHTDILVKPDNVNWHYVCTANANPIERDTASISEYATIPSPRTIGTSDETIFDIFSIDRANRKVTITRFGAGEDRQFTY